MDLDATPKVKHARMPQPLAAAATPTYAEVAAATKPKPHVDKVFIPMKREHSAESYDQRVRHIFESSPEGSLQRVTAFASFAAKLPPQHRARIYQYVLQKIATMTNESGIAQISNAILKHNTPDAEANAHVYRAIFNRARMIQHPMSLRSVFPALETHMPDSLKPELASVLQDWKRQQSSNLKSPPTSP